MDLAHLGLRVGAAPGIVDDVVGAPGLLGDGHLAPDPGAGVSLARPVARPQSLELYRLVDDDHDDPVHAGRSPDLEEQRHVPDDHTLELLFLQRAEEALLAGAHGGVDDGLEPLAPLRVGEDDGAQALPVEIAVVLDHLAAELGHDGSEGGLTRGDRLAREQIGVDHLAAEVGEHGAHRALARGDTPREAREEEGPHT